MRELYKPRNYTNEFARLENHSRRPATSTLVYGDRAFVRSLWLLGFWHRGRLAYWRFCITTLLRRPRLFPVAVEPAITGHHFRRMAGLL